MTEPAYLTSIKEALTGLDMAYFEAEAELPEEIKQEHAMMVRSAQVVDPWHALSWRYPHVSALDALAFISEMRAKAKGLSIRVSAESREADREANGQSKHDLSLGRMRRYPG